jgi:glutamine phosphoribosylpyrophosphate amidotransferase
MCGAVGIVSKTAVNQTPFDALTVLQDRGQDAAGVVTARDGHFFMRKSTGLVNDVLRARHLKRLTGALGIGHVWYPTAEAQPFYVNSPYGIALAHNGNLTNAGELGRRLLKDDLRHMNTGSDTEVLLNVFAHELQKLGRLACLSGPRGFEGQHLGRKLRADGFRLLCFRRPLRYRRHRSGLHGPIGRHPPRWCARKNHLPLGR